MLFSGIVFETKMMIILCLAESEIEEYGYQIGAKKMRRKGRRGFEFELTISQQLKEFGSKIKLGFE